MITNQITIADQIIIFGKLPAEQQHINYLHYLSFLFSTLTTFSILTIILTILLNDGVNQCVWPDFIIFNQFKHHLKKIKAGAQVIYSSSHYFFSFSGTNSKSSETGPWRVNSTDCVN